MSNNANDSSKRGTYSRQSVIINSFYQMPRFLTTGVFEGSNLSNNARVLYSLLLDRHKVSVKNGWFDENEEVYIYFKKEEMEKQLGISKVTVLKVMRELKSLLLVKEKKQGLNMPNKIYLLFPVIGENENVDLYLEPKNNYNSDVVHDESGGVKFTPSDT